MALWYEPELIDYRLQSYERDNKHYVRGQLISTKMGDNGWSPSRKTIEKRVKLFEKYPFIVSPKQLDPSSHYLVGSDYQEQLILQKDVTKGFISNIFGPFEYNDGTDDVYYDFEAEVTDKPISEALLTGRLPFMTSPYIWPVDENGTPLPMDKIKRKQGVEDWIPVHVALVDNAAWGENSKIHKQCVGPQGKCNQALAGSSEDVAKIISSQILTEKQTNVTMENNSTDSNSQTSTTTTSTGQPIEVRFTTDNVPKTNVPNTEEQKPEVNPEIEALKKESAEKDKIIEKMVLRQKIADLDSIFTGTFESEDAKKATYKKYQDLDTERLIEFHADVLKYGIPKSFKKELNKDNAHIGSSNNQKETFPLTGSNEKLNSPNTKEESLISLLGGLA